VFALEGHRAREALALDQSRLVPDRGHPCDDHLLHRIRVHVRVDDHHHLVGEIWLHGAQLRDVHRFCGRVDLRPIRHFHQVDRPGLAEQALRLRCLHRQARQRDRACGVLVEFLHQSAQLIHRVRLSADRDRALAATHLDPTDVRGLDFAELPLSKLPVDPACHRSGIEMLEGNCGPV